MSLSTMIVGAVTNAMEREAFKGRTDWPAREFIRRQYQSGKTNFYEVFDFYSIFTPIERETWEELVALGMVFYPQYPVGKYFADFASPDKKIVIECDGKQHNRAKDAIRDQFFEGLGWKVFRIKGRDCFGEGGTAVLMQIQEQYFSTKAPEVARNYLDNLMSQFERAEQ